MSAKLAVISALVLAAASAAVESRSTVSGTGQVTFYATGHTACGVTNKDMDYIAPVLHAFFDSYPSYNSANTNSNPLCGKTVAATYKSNLKTVTVANTDRCEGCA